MIDERFLRNKTLTNSDKTNSDKTKGKNLPSPRGGGPARLQKCGDVVEEVGGSRGGRSPGGEGSDPAAQFDC